MIHDLSCDMCYDMLVIYFIILIIILFMYITGIHVWDLIKSIEPVVKHAGNLPSSTKQHLRVSDG